MARIRARTAEVRARSGRTLAILDSIRSRALACECIKRSAGPGSGGACIPAKHGSRRYAGEAHGRADESRRSRNWQRDVLVVAGDFKRPLGIRLARNGDAPCRRSTDDALEIEVDSAGRRRVGDEVIAAHETAGVVDAAADRLRPFRIHRHGTDGRDGDSRPHLRALLIGVDRYAKKGWPDPGDRQRARRRADDDGAEDRGALEDIETATIVAVAVLSPWPTTPAALTAAVTAALKAALSGKTTTTPQQRLGATAAALVERYAPGAPARDPEVRGGDSLRWLAARGAQLRRPLGIRRRHFAPVSRQARRVLSGHRAARWGCSPLGKSDGPGCWHEALGAALPRHHHPPAHGCRDSINDVRRARAGCDHG